MYISDVLKCISYWMFKFPSGLIKYPSIYHFRQRVFQTLLFNCVFFLTKLHTELCFQRGSTSQHQSFKVTFPIKQVYSCSFINIHLIYTTACHFCLYVVARLDFSSALCIVHGGVPSRCAHTHTQTSARTHTQTGARAHTHTHTHTNTCAHTQVSTLSVSAAAADAELEVAEQLPTCYGHYQCLTFTGSNKADRK